MAVGEGCWQKMPFSIATGMIATCHKRWQRPTEPNGWLLPSKNGRQCHCSFAQKKWHHPPEKKGCCQQHPVFPGGHPSKYWLGSTLLNFSDRTRTGVFNVIWPLSSDEGKWSVYKIVLPGAFHFLSCTSSSLFQLAYLSTSNITLLCHNPGLPLAPRVYRWSRNS